MEKRLFPFKEFDVDRIQFVHPGTANSGVYLHAVGHHPLTGGEGYQWAWVRCADAEIGARLVKAFKRAARICGAHGTHDNAPFNDFPDAGTIRSNLCGRLKTRQISTIESMGATRGPGSSLELELQHTGSAVVPDLFKWRKHIKRGF